MDANNKIWAEIGKLTDKFTKLNLTDAIDYTKFYIYSLITHSTAIEDVYKRQLQRSVTISSNLGSRS